MSPVRRLVLVRATARTLPPPIPWRTNTRARARAQTAPCASGRRWCPAKPDVSLRSSSYKKPFLISPYNGSLLRSGPVT